MFESLNSILRNFDMILQISAAQQYVDDLYDLEVTIDNVMEEDPSQDMPVPQQTSSGLPFYSSVDVSLGTGEVSQSELCLHW